MTFKKLVLELCKREGKKKQVNVAQMSEVVKCLIRIFKDNPVGVLKVFLK